MHLSIFHVPTAFFSYLNFIYDWFFFLCKHLFPVTVLLNDSKNGDFKKYADFNVDSLNAIINLITSQERFSVDREDSNEDA